VSDILSLRDFKPRSPQHPENGWEQKIKINTLLQLMNCDSLAWLIVITGKQPNALKIP